MSKYREIAHALRARIRSGEFPVGERLPAIAALQAEYHVPGLNTVRKAQQVLVTEGYLRTQQGVGAFVIATEPPTPLDPVAVLTDARTSLDAVIEALKREAKSTVVTFDVADDDVHFVLTSALQRFAQEHRDMAQDGPVHLSRGQWAETAETLLARIEEAL